MPIPTLSFLRKAPLDLIEGRNPVFQLTTDYRLLIIIRRFPTENCQLPTDNYFGHRENETADAVLSGAEG